MMKFRIENNDDVKEVLRQLKYDSQEMLSKIEYIENAEKLIVEFKGKPKEETCRDAIRLWSEEYNEHEKMFELYVNKYKNISNELQRR